MSNGKEESTVLGKANFIKDAAEKLQSTVFNMAPSQAALGPNAPKEKTSGIDEISATLDAVHAALVSTQCFLDDVIRAKLGV